jgi:hypothetical protein
MKMPLLVVNVSEIIGLILLVLVLYLILLDKITDFISDTFDLNHTSVLYTLIILSVSIGSVIIWRLV